MAQQGKSDLVFSGTLAHYIRSGIESGNQGFYVYPVDPGLKSYTNTDLAAHSLSVQG